MDDNPKAHDKFRQEIEDLKEQLLKMAGLAEAALDQSIKALLTHDSDLAREVIQGDRPLTTWRRNLTRPVCASWPSINRWPLTCVR